MISCLAVTVIRYLEFSREINSNRPVRYEAHHNLLGQASYARYGDARDANDSIHPGTDRQIPAPAGFHGWAYLATDQILCQKKGSIPGARKNFIFDPVHKILCSCLGGR